MKKSIKLFALALASSFVLAGCDDFTPNWPMEAPNPEDMVIDTPWVDYIVPCSSISFNKGETSIELNKGQTHTFTYTTEPRDATLSSLVWESENVNVATVENGVLTAVGGGSTSITVSSGEVSARAKVNVVVPITDFEVTNKALDLDYGAEMAIETTFEPEDTTQGKLTYELAQPGVITVSEDGVVTALQAEGDAEVRVTNEVLNKVEIVNVHVSDKWNYVSSFTLDGPENLEVTKEGKVEADVKGIHEDVPATTLRNNKVSYAVKEGSDEGIVSVDAETGALTALEVGDTTIEASLLDERAGEVKKAEFDVHVFEVSATGISLNESSTIELNNKDEDKASYQLHYEYTLDDTSYEVPSRGHITYTSSDSTAVKVNDEGLIECVGVGKDGTGNATITVTDTTYGVSDTVDVHSTIYAKSISLVASQSFYLDETVTITANVTPAETSENLVWDYDEKGHTAVENGNQLTITCNNLEDEIKVGAHIGAVAVPEAGEVSLKPAERDIDFENGKAYIVGSANYKKGVSKDTADGEGSWTRGKYAYVMTDKTGNLNAKYEYKSTIEFRKDDEWKIRENASDWREVEGYAGEGEAKHQIGRYKVDEGAFAKGQMSVTDDDDKNVIVNQAGKYDIYYAMYTNEHPEGWYEVYVEEHGLKLSVEEVHAKLTSPASASVITASNWDGSVGVKDVNNSYISVQVNSTTGEISITPKAKGQTTFKVYDDVKEIEVSVYISKESTATETDYYVRGTAVGSWDCSEANILRESSNVNNIGEALDIYLSQGEFKIANEEWSSQWGYYYKNNDEEQDHVTVIGGAKDNFALADGPDGNIKCNVAGYYDIYLTTNNYISIEHASTPVVGLTLSALEAQIETDEVFVVTATGVEGTLAAVSGDTGVATVSVSGNVTTITPVAAGNATITFSDESGGDPVAFELTVVAAAAKVTRYVETKGWFNSGAANEKVYVYAFDSTTGKENAAFPGVEATWRKNLSDEPEYKKLFSYDMKEYFDTFIVVKVVDDNPTYQTVDIEVSELGGENCVYLVAQPTEGNIVEVGHYDYSLGLSLYEDEIEQGENTIVTVDNYIGEITATPSSSDVTTSVSGNVVTISSDTIGDYTVSISDESGCTAQTFTLHVIAPVAKTRQYIETKSFFNDGETPNQKVCVYAWKQGSDPFKDNAAFPGEVATYVKNLEDGKKLFYFDIAETYDYFIVSDVVGDIASTNVVLQTENVEIAELGGKNCIYMHELDDLDDGHVKVGSYNYQVALSAESGTIGVDESTNITVSHFLGTPTCTSTDDDHVTVTINATTGVATISADQAGSYTLTFGDDSTYTATYELTVQAAATKKRVYFESKPFFNSNQEGEKVKAYCWNSSNTSVNNGWPGEVAEWVADIEDGKKIFYFDVDITKYDSIIFTRVLNDSSDHSMKTADVALSSLTTTNCVYLNTDAASWSDPNAPIPVGSYAYIPS